MRLKPTFLILAFVLAACGRPGVRAAETGSNSDSVLVHSAQDQVRDSKMNGDSETACSIFVMKVLKRVGLNVEEFTANDMDQVMEKHLPQWKMTEFLAGGKDNGREALRSFLNALPDGAGVIAQWEREGRSGHVAIIEKAAVDKYTIYQAQQGKATPHTKPIKLEYLLYMKNQWGDRSRLRIYEEPAE